MVAIIDGAYPREDTGFVIKKPLDDVRWSADLRMNGREGPPGVVDGPIRYLMNAILPLSFFLLLIPAIPVGLWHLGVALDKPLGALRKGQDVLCAFLVSEAGMTKVFSCIHSD